MLSVFQEPVPGGAFQDTQDVLDLAAKSFAFLGHVCTSGNQSQATKRQTDMDVVGGIILWMVAYKTFN